LPFEELSPVIGSNADGDGNVGYTRKPVETEAHATVAAEVLLAVFAFVPFNDGLALFVVHRPGPARFGDASVDAER